MDVKRILAAAACLCLLWSGAAFAEGDVPAGQEEPVAAEAFPAEEAEPVRDIRARTKAILDEYNDASRPKTHYGVVLGHVYVPEGTKILLELQEPISSKTSREGQLFELKSVNDVVINQVVVIPAGTTCIGKVLEGRGNKGFGRGGRLELAISSIPAANGAAVPLNGYVRRHGKKSATWFAPWWIAAFMKGKELTYEKGQRFLVTVRRNADLQTGPEDLAEAMGQDGEGQYDSSISVDAMT